MSDYFPCGCVMLDQKECDFCRYCVDCCKCVFCDECGSREDLIEIRSDYTVCNDCYQAFLEEIKK